MRKLLLVFLTGLFGLFSVPASSESPWETSLDKALARAGREHKPVLLLELFGSLDEKLC